MFNWKLAGEVYGVFSKVCFMIDSDRYDVDDDIIEAYEVASRDFENGEVNEELLQVLIDFITDNTNSNYWIDFDEPLFDEDEDDEDIEVLDEDEDDYCTCGCCDCEDEDDDLSIDPEEVKRWARQIGAALDKAVEEQLEGHTNKPIRIEISVKEG